MGCRCFFVLFGQRLMVFSHRFVMCMQVFVFSFFIFCRQRFMMLCHSFVMFRVFFYEVQLPLDVLQEMLQAL